MELSGNYKSGSQLELLIVVGKPLRGVGVNVGEGGLASADIVHHGGGSLNWVLVILLGKLVKSPDMHLGILKCGHSVLPHKGKILIW